MKWFAIPALITCGLNSMLGAIILCLGVYHLLTNKSTNAPILPNEQWIRLMKGIIPFSVFWIIFSLIGMHVSMSKRHMLVSLMVIAVYAIFFGVSIYFTIAFGKQLEMEDVDAEVLYNATMDEISEASKVTWIPGWLDNIQKRSKYCCGINTYRDYEDFWPSAPTRIPRSCCKESKLMPAPCPFDFTHIAHPNTADDFVKVESGCKDEIRETVLNHIRESHHNSIAATIFIGCGTAAYVFWHVKQYVTDGPSPQTATKESNKVTVIRSEEFWSSSGPLFIKPSGQIASSIGSMEIQQFTASIDSVGDGNQIGAGQPQGSLLSPVTSSTMISILLKGDQQLQQVQEEQAPQFQRQQPIPNNQQQLCLPNQQQNPQFRQPFLPTQQKQQLQQGQQFKEQQPLQTQQQLQVETMKPNQPQKLEQQALQFLQQVSKQPVRLQQPQRQQLPQQLQQPPIQQSLRPEQFQQQQQTFQPQLHPLQQLPQIFVLDTSSIGANPEVAAIGNQGNIYSSIANDVTPPKQANQMISQSLNNPRAVPQTGSVYLGDDLARADQPQQFQAVTSQSPGSPGGRLKKVRKAALAKIRK